MARVPRIIIGIDFGTTSTLVAWANTAPPVQIELLRNWPTCGPPVGVYVPTEVAYPDGATTKFAWGHNIQARSRKIQWFKLGLETEKQILPLPPHKTAADVVQDFLAALYEHIQTTLSRRFEPHVLDKYQLDYYLTVPAIWSDAAKQRMLTAATRAGLPASNLELISEPESAALYTLRNLEDLQARIKVDDRIVVCDAGGGTVDVIAYDVVEMQPRLRVQESAAGTGEFCGSTFIDREFEGFFKVRVGGLYEEISQINRQQVAKNFETAKLSFRDDPEHPVFYVGVPGVANSLCGSVVDGNFQVTREEMKALYDPIVGRIIKLIRDQVVFASVGSRQVSSILLVGGFGESEYLYQQIKAWASPHSVQIIQPREARTAIAQGAVYKGLETEPDYQTEVVRRARRSYGFPTSERFVDGHHLKEDLFIEPYTGEKMARNQISWLIKKNQILQDSETFRRRFAREFKLPTVWSHTVLSSDLDEPPSRISSTVHMHCTITADLNHRKAKFKRKWKKLQSYYTTEYALVMGLKNNNLSVYLEHQGVLYGIKDIVFE